MKRQEQGSKGEVQTEPRWMTLDEQISQLYREREGQRERKMLWRGLALLILAVIAWRGFGSTTWQPHFDENALTCRRESWWGFAERAVRCEWRKDSDADRDPRVGWCAKYPDGKWHIFFAEEGDNLVIYWPKDTTGGSAR